jgi:ribonucleoside-diphosphate reductase beta chain
VLLSFNKDGRYKGLAQIISWSAIDEQTHSEAGCQLFRRLVDEVGISEDDKKAIYDGFQLVIDKEFAFIDHIFNSASISSIDANELKAYIKNRANERLLLLGLDQMFKLSTQELTQAKSVSSWFDPMVKGASSTDFFAASKDGANYVAKVSQDFMTVDLSALDLILS